MPVAQVPVSRYSSAAASGSGQVGWPTSSPAHGIPSRYTVVSPWLFQRRNRRPASAAGAAGTRSRNQRCSQPPPAAPKCSPARTGA